MATETPTPIAALEQYPRLHHDGFHNVQRWSFELCGLPSCVEARCALADVEALVALMQRIGYDEELSYLACPGPPNCDGSHYDTCPVALARAALAKFTVKQ